MKKNYLILSLMMAHNIYAADQTIVSPYCWNNQDIEYLYYKTPTDTDRLPNDLHSRGLFTDPHSNTFKPMWDLRYVNPSSSLFDAPNHASYTGLDTRYGNRASAFGTNISRWYNAGSIVQTECVNGLLAGGTMVNLWDTVDQSIGEKETGGPQATFKYRIIGNIRPWNNGKNLRIQANFDRPIYTKSSGNIGGNISFVASLQNIHNPALQFYYVMPVWGYSNGYGREQYIGHDNNLYFASAPFISTEDDGTRYAIASQYSNQTFRVTASNNVNPTSDDGIWPHFFRVNVPYKSFQKALNDIGHSSKPEDWRVIMLGIQFEIEEDGGKGSIAGSFLGYSAAITDSPQ